MSTTGPVYGLKLKPGVSALNIRPGPGEQYGEPIGKLLPGVHSAVAGKSLDGKWVWLSGPKGWAAVSYLVESQMQPPATTPKPRAWRVAESLLTLRRQVDERAPKRGKAYDGTIGDAAHAAGKSDHNPMPAPQGAADRTPVVRALDLTHDPEGGADMGALAEALRKAKDPRLKYVIYGGRMFSSYASKNVPPWTWRNYSGVNAHLKHLHLSVLPDPGLYDDPREWRIT